MKTEVKIWINEFQDSEINPEITFSADIYYEKRAPSFDEINWNEHLYTSEQNNIIVNYLEIATEELFKAFRKQIEDIDKEVYSD